MLKKFKRAINKLCLFYPVTNELKEFKEELLSSLLDKYDELIAQGYDSDRAYYKCIDSLNDYKETLNEMYNNPVVKEKKSWIKQILTGSLVYILGVTLIYFLISFTAGWHLSWLTFVIGAILAGIVVMSALVYEAQKKSAFTLIRCAVPLGIIVVSACVYLLASFLTNAWYITWITFIFAVFFAHGADMLLRYFNKKRLYVYIDVLVPTLSVALISYFLFSFLMNAWSSTWIIFIAWIFIYAFITYIIKFIDHRKSK